METVLSETTSGTATRHRRRNITLCVIASVLYWIALYLYRPTLSTYVENMLPNELALVGVILSMYGLGQMIIRVPLGMASDWAGRRKPFIMGGFMLAAIGAAVMGRFPSAGGLLGGHAIVGFAAGTWVPLVVLFSSFFPAREAVRASSMLTLVGSLGRTAATAITGLLNDQYGYSMAFMLAVVAALVAVAIMAPSRETALPASPPSLRSLLALLTRRDVLVPSLLSMIMMYAVWSSVFGFVPILAKELGASDVVISLMVSSNILVVVLGNLIATAVVLRFGEARMLYATFALIAIGLAGMAAAPTVPLLIAAQFCIGLAQGLGYPVLMGLSIRDVQEAQRSTAMGLHQSIYAIGMFAGPALTGVLAERLGLHHTFYVTATMTLLIGLFGTGFMRTGGTQQT